jgi:hypothetical protein
VRHCFPAIDKIERTLGFRPSRSFEAGMEELIDWVAHVRRPPDRAPNSLKELDARRLVV